MADFMTLASVSDLESGWRTLSPNERETASELLDRASAKICAKMRFEAEKADDLTMMNMRTVCCDMVRRAMTERGDAFGLGQTSDGYGAWEDQTPVTDLYFTAQEQDLLGVGTSARSVFL